MMNCIIIDDKVNSELLGRLVAKCSSLNLIHTYNDPISAFEQLSKLHHVDLAIIDVRIAGLGSLDRIIRLSNPPGIIGVSSNGQYAMKAFVYNFVDYLIKPVSYSRFCRAVDKAIRYNSQKDFWDSDDKEIFIKVDSSLVRLNMKDITYIEALENYITLNTINKKYTIHFTMKGMGNQLPPEIFIRIHRSFFVNKRLIKTINENNLQIILGANLKYIPIGKSFRDTILKNISVMKAD
jgi:DNA-binding LytR/AlgR family response regulator